MEEMNFNKEDFKNFMLKITKENDYRNIIDAIFELNVRRMSPDMHIDLINNLSESFQMDCSPLISYVVFVDEYYKTQDINLSDNGALNYINNLKKKYRFIIKKNFMENREPLALSSVSINMQKATSHASISLRRNDGENLNFTCIAQSLLSLVVSTETALLTMINEGIYNLNAGDMKNLVGSSKELIQKLDEILSDNKG